MYLINSGEIKLFTISLFIIEASTALLSSMMHFLHVNLDFLYLCFLLHTWNCFVLRCSACLYIYKFTFKLTFFFLLSGQSVTCTRGFIIQSDWYRQSQAPKVDNFSHKCYQDLSSPRFRGESMGTRLLRDSLGTRLMQTIISGEEENSMRQNLLLACFRDPNPLQRCLVT